MDRNEIKARLEKNGILFREELPGMLVRYMYMLQEWNRRMDLTSVCDEEETLDRHFIDSLTVLKTGLLSGAMTMIDVGTGAGFPGMVLAMACPDLHVTLLDSQRKRLTFLEEVGKTVQVGNISIIHARAEDGGHRPELRERFDIAAARALAPAGVLCEYLLPFVRTGGCALFWKGPALKDETDSGRRAAHLLGGKLETPVSCPITDRNWEHQILPVRKLRHTPSMYPRKAGIPKRIPLGL